MTRENFEKIEETGLISIDQTRKYQTTSKRGYKHIALR